MERRRGEGTRSLIMVTLGTGVGGGIIVDGKIVTGAHGAGGEIGHACVDPSETESCNCGNKGCLEQMASATGIVRLAKKILAAETESTVLNAEDISAKAIFDAYKEGDAIAAKIVRSLCGISGKCVGNFWLCSRSGSICNRRRRIKSRTAFDRCSEKILSERCIPLL